MSDRELLIARYVDAAPAEREQIVAHASLDADPALREDIEFETFIQRTLIADRDSLSQQLDLPAVSAAPLDVLLNETPPTRADNNVIYFVLAGVVLIIAWLVYFLVSQPSSDQSPKSAPTVSQPPVVHPQQPAVPPAPAEHTSAAASTEAASKHPSSANVHPAKTDRNQIDLDKDLVPPKVYDDKKAQMPLKKQ